MYQLDTSVAGTNYSHNMCSIMVSDDYSFLSFTPSTDSIRIECGTCSIVIPFLLWQRFESKRLYSFISLLDKGQSENELRFRFAIGKHGQLSPIYDIRTLVKLDLDVTLTL